jgi:hypothetical protein
MRTHDGDDRDEEAESLVDRIVEKGKAVFSHDWDSGGPGAGAGSETVYRWRGKFAIGSEVYENPGPFGSLDEALEELGNLLTVTGATTDIWCSLLTAEELAKRLQPYDDDEGYAIMINDEPWAYRKGKGFKRIEDGDVRPSP